MLAHFIYLALCGPVLWSSYEEEALRAKSSISPDSRPNVSLQWPIVKEKETQLVKL